MAIGLIRCVIRAQNLRKKLGKLTLSIAKKAPGLLSVSPKVLIKQEAVQINKKLLESKEEVSFNPLFETINNHFIKNKSNLASSVIITGYARVGKSIIANKVAEASGLSVLPVDTLRTVYDGLTSRLKHKTKNRFYCELVKRFPKGIILEGFDLLINEDGDSGETENTYSLDLLVCIQKNSTPNIYLLGNKDATIDNKAQGLIEYRTNARCWTTGKKHKERYNRLANIQKLAYSSIKVSDSLFFEAVKNNIKYIEVRPECFNSDVDFAVNKILEAL